MLTVKQAAYVELNFVFVDFGNFVRKRQFQLIKMVAELSTVCCGCNLKHGTVAIGVVQALLAFTFMMLTAAYAEHPHELLDLSDPTIATSATTLKCLLIIISVASAVQCIFSIMLVFAAESNRPNLLVPWLVFNPIAIGIYVISTIVGLVHHNGISNTGYVISHLVVGLAICLIGGYKIVAVHSYYKHLKSLNF